MAYNYDHNYQQSGPGSHYAPPPPQHQYDAYPMTQVHSPPPQQNYYDPDSHYNNYKASSPGGYNHAVEEDRYANATPITPIDYRERRSCCDTICCGCCTCCPRWIRYLSCIILLLIVCLAIVVGVLAALFKKPSVEFQGLQGAPTFNLNGTTAVLDFNMTFAINNPNIESVTFSNVGAEVYYPNYSQPIGNGTKTDLHISSHSNTTIYFPISLFLDFTNNATLPIAQDLLTKCSASSKVTVDYTIIPTIRIIGIPITLSFSSSASFDCNVGSNSELSSILGILGGLIGSGAGSGISPGTISSLLSGLGGQTAIPTSIPSGLPF